MAKESVIFRQGPLDGQVREMETSKDHYTHNEIKKDMVLIHHYKREKKENKEAEKMDEFLLDHVEYKKPDNQAE